MSLIPWRNKRETRPGETSPMFALRGEVDRLFDAFLREPLAAMDWPIWGAEKWSPAVDVVEKDNEVAVRAELPGIDPKDIDVSVSGNQLVISGEKKETSESEEQGIRHRETRYGAFHRAVPLPEGVDTENVEADYSRGVLNLRLKRTAPAAAKRIEVKVK